MVQVASGGTAQADLRDIGDIVRAAGAAELVWAGVEGPQAQVVVPLWGSRGACLALPYSDHHLATTLGRVGRATLAVTDPRTADPQARPAVLDVTVEVRPDPDGREFCDGLLQQELRKHPPSRPLADSLMLRRENWWFVPRLLVDLTVVDVRQAPTRTDPRREVLLLVEGQQAPEVAVVRLPGDDVPTVEPHQGDDLPAALFSHDCSVPDQERRVQRLQRGRLQRGRFVPSDHAAFGLAPLPAPASALARWRERTRFRRACEAGLRAAQVLG